MPFALDPRLAEDTHALGDLPLCRVLLMDDRRFPWLILVPRRTGATDIVDLAADERARLMEEIAAASAALRDATAATKLNVAALGNRVAQLHVHVIARFATDAAWPDPVWGRGTAVPYGRAAAAALAAPISAALALA